MSAANCPETPRQKMISMMYLVLTAMLALNVSIEILSGYSLVDGSLRESIKIAETRNKSLNFQFESLADKNPSKAADWLVKAQQVNAMSDSLYNYINEIKRRIIVTIDGKPNPTDTAAIARLERLQISENGRGDLNITGQIGVTVVPGQPAPMGPILREKIEAYRDFLVSGIVMDSAKNVTTADSAKASSIKNTFSTEDVTSKEAGKQKWEFSIFNNMPAIATLTILSKIQNDVRNTQAEIIQYLIAQIDAGDFRVNKINAMAIPNSNYVIRGGKYRAEIILAATDSTQTLDIEVNGVKIEKGEDNKYWYEQPASVVGKKDFKGSISMTRPDETKVTYDFNSSFTVAEPSATISADMMNVFYAGIDNPVSVSVPGVSAGDVDISVSNATQSRTGKGWNIRPTKVGVQSVVTVTALFEGKRQVVASKPFRVKPLPPPLAKLKFADASKTPFKGGTIEKNLLVTATHVIAELDDADLDVKYNVLSFQLSYTDSMGNTLIEPQQSGGQITAKQMGIFKNLVRGKTVYITNTQAKGPDGIQRRLPPVDISLR